MRARTVVLLLAGRGAARLAQYGAGLALLGVWNENDFARYAAATGVGVWLLSLSASGIERGALVLVGAPGGRRLESLFAWFALVPFALSLLVWAVLGLAWPGSTAAGYAAGTAIMGGTGSITVLVGLFRVRGRPMADAVAYAAISATYVITVALAAVAGFGVDGLLTVHVGLMVVINAVLLAVLRPDLRRVAGRTDALFCARTVALVAAGDLFGGICVSLMFALLDGRAPARQATLFFVCMLVSAAFGVAVNYLLRLWQGPVLAWLADSPDVAQARIRRVVLVVSVAGGLLVAGAAVLALVQGGTTTAAVVALAVETVVFVAVSVAAFVVESVDDRSRQRSAVSAVVSLAVVAGLGWLLVPVAGAAGALVALAAGWAARAPVLLPGAARPPGEPPSAIPVDRYPVDRYTPNDFPGAGRI